MDWYTWNPKLYLADTLNFTLAEDGAYRRLIDYYMETRAPIPSNKVALCRILGIGQDEFAAIAEQVLSKFDEVAGELHHRTCDNNLDQQDSLSKKRSDVAISAAKKRNKNKASKTVAEQKPGNSPHTRQDKTGEDSKEVSIGAEKSAPKTKRGTRLSEEWVLPKEWAEWATANGAKDPFPVADRFRDYWIGVSGAKGVKSDWAATWRNWIRNDYGGKAGAQSNTVNDAFNRAAQRIMDNE